MTDIRTLVFDTETNGRRMKKPRGAPYSWEAPMASEPAVTQLAAMLFEGRRPVAHFSCFVHPINFDGSPAQIPDEKFFKEAGITHERIDAVGLPYRVGMAMFNQMVKVCDRIVAHNILFDDPVLRSAYSRIAAPQRDYWNKPKFCTMQSLENVLKLPGKYGKYKWPTLDESYRALVDPLGFDGAHDAMVDVEACAKVLWVTEDKGHKLWRMPENWPEE